MSGKSVKRTRLVFRADAPIAMPNVNTPRVARRVKRMMHGMPSPVDANPPTPDAPRKPGRVRVNRRIRQLFDNEDAAAEDDASGDSE